MLTAISPVDGRYANKTRSLVAYFSEYALIRYRVKIEIEYFIALLKLELPVLRHFDENKISDLRGIISNFSAEDANRIKEIEKKTNHDVKAVEYFLKEKFETIGILHYAEMIHFGLTSQDINNTAIPISIREATEEILLAEFNDLYKHLTAMARSWQAIPMLAHTHGQPASPTTAGKELFIFAHRMKSQIDKLGEFSFYGKFGGAVGNFNAHVVAYPQISWPEFADQFLLTLGLKRLPYTTQIDHYDSLAELLHILARINTILIDLCRDIWTYISMNYFNQKIKEGEVGSSTMPHKVNPIDFENAEGNLGIANALYYHLAEKLPISRLQRDLTDSTVLRNIGVPFAHTLVAIQSIQNGLKKIELNREILHSDLEKNWAVVAEAYQTILRREGIDQPYELLKAFTRGKPHLHKEDLLDFINTLSVDEAIKKELRLITPHNYTGLTTLPSENNPSPGG